MPRARIVAALLGCVGLSALVAAPEPPAPYNPPLAKASDEAEKAVRRFQLDKGLTVSVWAAEPMLAHPVAFCFDEHGRCYVAETFRHSAGVTDNRGHMNWLDDELAARTVADRVAVYKKFAKDRFARDYERERERVRLLEDTAGKGKADKSTVFRDDFGRAEDGIGAGLLARKGNVYFTCIPDLWLLKDGDGDGKAEVKESLATGYGVHVAFIGHDLHGLRMGPDGRIYYSIGDRGLNVTTKEGKKLFYPDTGAIVRCEPDGSNLEVVATGLRNPQELAFDDYGNLFTVDNNSDSGDQARWVHVVEGGDSGWRIGYQYGSSMHDATVRQQNRGPWNYEKLWHTQHEGQPAYILPPLKHFSAGPSGFTHYPGVGLSNRYEDHFFLVDFRGGSGGSGVWSFATKPKGASFEMTDDHRFVWSVLATDCEFGPDGAFYLTDWVEGWNKNGKGRIYKITDPEAMKNPVVAEAKKLLAEGFDKRPINELVKLLGHPHRQVRMEAQFALAAQLEGEKSGKSVKERLLNVAVKGENRLARLHAIWALGQISPGHVHNAYRELRELAGDNDAEVRAQVVTVIGRHNDEWELFVKMMKDPEPRVRFLAAMALGTWHHTLFMTPEPSSRIAAAAEEILRDNADRDPYLRHAATRILAGVPIRDLTLALDDASPAVRLGAVVALRRAWRPPLPEGEKNVKRKDRFTGIVEVLDAYNPKEFADAFERPLKDNDPRIVAEAARAIHDVPIPDALPKLAALADNPKHPPAALYRALNAHMRLGKPENAAALAKFAARDSAPESLRVFALELLADWAKPKRRDYVTGLTQALGDRAGAVAADAVRANLVGVFSGSDKVRQAAVRAAGKLGIKEVGPVLLSIVGEKDRPAEVRIDALEALEGLKDSRLSEGVKTALASEDAKLRAAGRSALSRRDPTAGAEQLTAALQKGETVEKQSALADLAAMKAPAAEKLLDEWLNQLVDGKVPPELRLDVLEAATKRAGSSGSFKEKLARYEATKPKGDELAAWRESLAGGDAARGRELFLTKSELSCVRCHKVGGEGGEVGPDLTGIAGKQTREYLLESLVLPNKQIAKGFETVVVALTNGKTVTGVLKSEDKDELRLVTAEGQPITIKQKDIDERSSGPSAMPADLLKYLTRSEMRDLVEFLAGLK